MKRLLLVCAAAVVAHAQVPRAFVTQYCIACHSQRLGSGGLVLENLDTDHVGANAEKWEKVVRKLRAGMMPPAGMPRPDRVAYDGFRRTLETALDRAVAEKPNPGVTALHRMNRGEYANAVRDLLALDVDAATLLPADDSSEGFDNIAEVLGVSPALMERYIAAAAKISRLAIGDKSISPAMITYKVRADVTQTDTVEGLPPGTRGGLLVKHTFPLDAEYILKVSLLKTAAGPTFGGLTRGEQMEITVNGERVKLFDAGYDLEFGGGPMRTNPFEIRIPMKAGPQAVGVTFLKKTNAAIEDVFQPFEASTPDISTGAQQEYTSVPHIASLAITGPYNAQGAGDTPSRRRLFVCHPANAAGELPCAKNIITALVRRAYRRPAKDSDVETLLSFYQAARNKDSFDAGIEMAVRRVLADPEFVFRLERDPANLATGAAFRISDLELASRLSFFLWSSIPDDELLNLATQGKLKAPAVLRQQTIRMLKDARSQALAANFAGQWLYLRQLKSTTPDSRTFPDFDDNLRQAFQKETELLFETILREDRSVLDLLNADYTFVNERLARHYGIPNVYGTDFRRVAITDENRRGLLGQGSMLLVTSMANRTSPVSRGKWILENVLGSPPPLPPPNVPPLKENEGSGAAQSVRARMEQHRGNPVCAACHKLMDPIGFSLENFDAIGRWRTMDSGFKIDASGQLVDGRKLTGTASLREALLAYPDAFTGTMIEKMLTYAVGRKLETYDMAVVRAIQRDAERNGNRFTSIIFGIVNSAPFQMKVKQPAGAAVAYDLNRGLN